MIEITTASLKEAADFRSDKPWAAIQITAPGYDVAELDNENLKGSLQLNYYDVDEHGKCLMPHVNSFINDLREQNKELIVFDADMARRVLHFVERMEERIEILLVHCQAGVSRSTGTAAAISRIYFGHDGNWFETKVPNRHVYRTILNEYHNQKDRTK